MPAHGRALGEHEPQQIFLAQRPPAGGHIVRHRAIGRNGLPGPPHRAAACG